MKIGDKVRIKTGKRGRPPVGELLEQVVMGDETKHYKWRVTTKNGPELYLEEELTLVNPA